MMNTKIAARGIGALALIAFLSPANATAQNPDGGSADPGYRCEKVLLQYAGTEKIRVQDPSGAGPGDYVEHVVRIFNAVGTNCRSEPGTPETPAAPETGASKYKWMRSPDLEIVEDGKTLDKGEGQSDACMWMPVTAKV